MRAISEAVAGMTASDTPDEVAQELHLNAFRTASLRKKLCEGRGWEGALVGLVRQVLEVGAVTGEPGWRRHRFLETSTTFEFASLAEWITDPNGLGTRPEHLIELLEISPEEEGRALADRVRQELKLPVGSNQYTTEGADSIRDLSSALRQQESGTSAAGVRRKIRNWIAQHPEASNLALAKEWLAKLEANPRSRLHQQALREIGIGKTKRVLDVSSVSEPLINRLYSLAKAEEMTVSEVIEDALAVYFAMEEEAAGQEPTASTSADSVNSGLEPVVLRELLPPGLYGASRITRATGASRSALQGGAARAKDGDEILKRVMADAPVKVILRKGNPPSERYEVMPR